MKREERLKEPRTPFARLLRSLAADAMAVTHHDIDFSEPEAVHEIEQMEKRFGRTLRSYPYADFGAAPQRTKA
jgi:hypothetical protein